MRKLVTILNIIIAFYFFVVANIFFWVSVLGLFVKVSKMYTEYQPMGVPWIFIINLILAPFLIYGAITFFRKTKKKYKYGLVLLSVVWVSTQVYRFFAVTDHHLETVDLENLLIFGVPFALVFLAKYLDQKYTS